MATGKGLGKGLNLIFNSGMTEEPVSSENPVKSIRISEIEPNPGQPRHNFDQIALEELAQSIRENGVITPLTLRKAGEKYQIIAGERRWRASRLAGLKEVPAHVIEADDRTAFALGLIENLQREDLNPVEEAAAIRFLMIQHNLTQEEVSSRIGRSRPAVTNALRLLNLPESVQGMLKDGTLSAGHGKMLAGLDDAEKAEKLAQKAVREGWSVRQMEEAVRLDALPRKKVSHRMDPEVRRTASAIRSKLRAKVSIEGDQEKGKIIISYFSKDDLMNICDAILGIEE